MTPQKSITKKDNRPTSGEPDINHNIAPITAPIKQIRSIFDQPPSPYLIEIKAIRSGPIDSPIGTQMVSRAPEK